MQPSGRALYTRHTEIASLSLNVVIATLVVEAEEPLELARPLVSDLEIMVEP